MSMKISKVWKTIGTGCSVFSNHWKKWRENFQGLENELS